MNRTVAYFASAGIGAAGMYLLDPTSGARRRALLRDKLVRGANKSSEGVAAAARDFSNRMAGVLAESRARLGHEEVPDDVLVARVRSAVGRSSSHPHAIHVTAQNGEVTLRGPVLAADVPQLLAVVRTVRGVAKVIDELEVHQTPGNVPALQGGASRIQRGSGWNGSPGRLAMGGTGAALLGYCLAKRERSTTWLGLIGAGLLARAGADWGGLRRLATSQPRRQALQKSDRAVRGSVKNETAIRTGTTPDEPSTR